MMATKNIRGLLVTNAFLKNGKFVEHYEWLREAAVKYWYTAKTI